MTKLNEFTLRSNEFCELSKQELETIDAGGWGEVITCATVSMWGLVFAVGAVVGYQAEKMKQ